MTITNLPKWFIHAVLALPLGILLGVPLPLMYFLSERRDWGKSYENYSDFVAVYVNWGVQYSLIAALIVWLLLNVSSWILHRRKLRKTTSHQASPQPDHE